MKYTKVLNASASWVCSKCRRTVQDATRCPYCG